jgi:hypothetical protein
MLDRTVLVIVAFKEVIATAIILSEIEHMLKVPSR